MDRTQKAELVSELNATFGEVGVVVVTRNLGMTVAQSTALRQKMREAGAAYKVSKNRLAKIALKDTAYEPISDSAGTNGATTGTTRSCSRVAPRPNSDRRPNATTRAADV